MLMDGKIKAILITLGLLYPLLINVASQECNVNVLTRGGPFTPYNLCAPVTVEWEPFYTVAEDISGSTVEFLFDWNDGNVEYVEAQLVDAAAKKWSIPTITHDYDSDQCHYNPELYIVVNGVVCENSLRSETVIVWDRDDRNGGEIAIDPRVFPICIGNSGSVTFMDNSQWNCVPPDEDDLPNNHKRWIQWIYGTNNGAPNFIDNARVNGVVRTYPYVGSIDVTSEPILAPTAPWNEALPIFVPDNRSVGDEFEVTLNNWNYCNPYDQGYPPVTTTAIVLIVDDPDGSITPVGPFCENDAPIILTPVTDGGQWSGTGIVDEWSGEFDPSIAGPGTHRIDYYVEDGNSCSATGFIDITVIESPLANIIPGPETYLCPGTQLDLDGNPSQGLIPYTHLWSGDTSPLNNTAIVNPSFETVNEGTYELVYRVTDNNGCYDEDTLVVEVDSVSIRFLNKNLELCTDISQSLEPNPVGGSGVFVFHQWSGDRTDLLSSTDTENPIFTSTTPGVYGYQYTVRDSYGCEDVDSIYVTVSEQPVSNAGNDAIACGLIYDLNAIPSVGSGQWTLNAGPGAVNFADASDPLTEVTVDTYGSYTFTWTEDNNGCVDSDDVNIAFNQVPDPSVINDADTCGYVYILQAFPDIGVGRWEQVFGPGAASFANPDLSISEVSVNTAGVYGFAWVEDNNGCQAGDTVKITFYPIPVASIGPFDGESCSPIEVTFNNTSSDADTYFWDFDDGYISNQSDPEHTFVNNTFDPIDYTIKLVASNSFGCVDTLNSELRVLPAPLAQFEYNDEPGCSPLEIEFTNQSEGATIYEWQFGDGDASALEDAKHIYTNEEQYVQSYKATLIAHNDYGCRDILDNYVTVYPLINYDFELTPSEGCHPLLVEMVSDPGAYSYTWNFGDGQSAEGANITSHVFENEESTPEDYTIKLYTSSVFGCRDTSEMNVTVFPSPVSNFTLTNSEGCSPFIAEFNNMSDGATSSKWIFDDDEETTTNDSEDIKHTYVNHELATVSFQPLLVVANDYGCKDSISKFLNVFPKVTAAISDGGEGCTPYMESLLNNSIGASQFTWNFGDGNTSNSFNGHNEYINNTLVDQDYEVEMIAESVYGCSDTTYTAVTVYRRPVPEFTVSPKELQMPKSTVQLANTTHGDKWNYRWLFGDETSSVLKDPSSHTYAASGEYEIWLRVDGENCSDSLRQIVTIYPTLPAIDYGPDVEGCPPLEVNFYNNTVDAHTFFWDFGDGNVSSEKEPVHTYHTSGKYKVKLMAEGPGGLVEADHVEINVYDTPMADFEVRPPKIKIPETVSFINKSEGATSYLWNFGDGNTSTEHSVQYAYQNTGIYDVRLTVTNELGCSDEHVIREAVIAEEAGSIDFPNAFTPNPAGSSGGQYIPGSPDNFVFYPFVHEGIVDYQLRIYTRWGELIFESQDIKIGWDGYHMDKICAAGVYIWKVTCKYSNGNIEIKTGDVTLFR